MPAICKKGFIDESLVKFFKDALNFIIKILSIVLLVAAIFFTTFTVSGYLVYGMLYQMIALQKLQPIFLK